MSRHRYLTGCVALVLLIAGVPQEGTQSLSAKKCYELGIQYLNENQWEEAGAQFKRAILVDSSYLEAHEKYQDVEYFYFDKKDQVLSEYRGLRNRNPSNALFHYLLARLERSELREKIVDVLKRALVLDSSFVPIYQDLVRTLLFLGKVEEADALVDAGLRHCPNNIHLLYLKSDVFAREGKTKESSGVLRQIVQLFPDSEETLFACNSLADLSETDNEKIQLLEYAVRLDASGIRSDSYDNLFELYARSNPAKAVQFARTSIMKNTSYLDRRLPAEMYYALYRLYIKTDTTKAVELAKEVSTLALLNPWLYGRFGNWIASLNREHTLAVKLFERAMVCNTAENLIGTQSWGPSSRSSLQQLSMNNDGYFRSCLGWTYYLNGEYQRSLDVLHSALGKNDQEDARIYYRIGLALEKLSKSQEAIAAYLQSLSFKEDHEVRSTLEKLASREANLKILFPPRRVTNIDSVIAEAQVTRARKAPDFILRNLDGVSVSSASFQGKALLIDFWATWCGPCIAELPKLQELFKRFEHDSGVSFVAISTDLNEDDVKNFIHKKGYTFPVLLNKGIETAYGVEGIPTLFVIDQYGLIRYKHVGYDPEVDFVPAISKEIEIILSGRAKN